jgi:hypothetical protein
MGAADLLWGDLEAGRAGEQVALRLMVWALLWLGLALAGLWRAQPLRWRAFWLMSGGWALINGIIALWGLLAPPAELDYLRQVLWINAVLDLGYLALAVGLMRRSQPMQQGFGQAIAIQGLFLLLFDLGHALNL